MGFLHAHPKTDKQTAPKPRISQFSKPPLPQITAGAYLRDAFLAVQVGELVPWSEIDAYTRLTGVLCEAWEAELIRSMSLEYLSGKRLGEDPFAYPPYED